MLWALSLCVLLTVFGSWTTIMSSPEMDVTSGIASASVGDLFYTSNGPAANRYDFQTDSWTTLSPAPTNRNGASGQAVLSNFFVVSGASTLTVEGYLLAQDVWTTRAEAPTIHESAASGSDGTLVWVAGGILLPDYTDVVEEYNALTDSWTTRKPMPTARGRLGGGYSPGVFVTVAGKSPDHLIIELYQVVTDAWTSATPVPDGHDRIHNAVCFASYLFALGGVSSSDFHRYHVPTDVWTTLDNRPITAHASGIGVHPSGKLISVLTFPGIYAAHTYVTGIVASVHGDPVFTAFDGSVHHLSLRSGVFNFLSTPTVVVNALVEYFPQLLPEESTFVTMVGVVALYRGCVIQVNFGASASQYQSSSALLFCPENGEVPPPIAANRHTQTLFLDDILLELAYNRAHYAQSAIDVAYLNLRVHSLAPSLTMGGLLSDLSARTLSDVQHGLDAADYYDVLDGCLFSLSTRSAARVFDHHEANQRLAKA